MSTSALVLVKNDEAMWYEGIFIHYDGGLNQLGRILVERYHSTKKALRFVNSRGPKCEKIEELIEALPRADYLYLWDTGRWSLLDEASLTPLYWYSPDELMNMQCSLCGQKSTLLDDPGEWYPEIRVGRILSTYEVCPDCISRYCKHDEEDHSFSLDLDRWNPKETPVLVNQLIKLLSEAIDSI